MLLQAIASNPCLEVLTLSSSRFFTDAAKERVPGIQSNKTLTRIELFHCQFVRNELSCFLRTLSNLENLKEINLTGNKCFNGGLAGICFLLRKCKLQSIQISSEDKVLRKKSLSALLRSLQSSSTVTTLNLSNNKLNDMNLQDISTFLTHNQTMMNVVLSGNKFTSDGVRRSLTTDIPRYHELKRLCINNHYDFLTLRVFEALKESIRPDNWSLQSIDVIEIVDDQLPFIMDLNRSYRSVLRDTTFPSSLWPLLLQRADRKVKKSTNHNQQLCRRASILYYFLRNSSTIFTS